MDLVLNACDEYLLDKMWASLVPLSAFADTVPLSPKFSPVATINGSTFPSSSPVPIALPWSWSSLVSSLPHPPLPSLALKTLDTVDVAGLSAWPRDYAPRQVLSLSLITLVGIFIFYFLFATLSFVFIFNHEMMKHPRFLKNQIKLEIQASLRAFPGMTFLTLPWFFAEVKGYSRLYDGVETYGWAYLVFSTIFFLVFTDYCVYWVHRWLHLPMFYKHLHKPHHKWIVPTPYASHAFHPVDGYMQSVPYHVFIFLFPLHRYLYLTLFLLVNFWSIFIHDSDMITGHPLEHVINGPAHHTLHHLYFTVNYGQYFTWADRYYNSYRHPDSSLDPMLEVKAAEASRMSSKASKEE